MTMHSSDNGACCGCSSDLEVGHGSLRVESVQLRATHVDDQLAALRVRQAGGAAREVALDTARRLVHLVGGRAESEERLGVGRRRAA